jgi:RimJ/RimL family protein N-acetyltransferase
VVISHDRWFLDRLATHILAFEGDSHVEWFEGNFEAYEADKRRRLGAAADQPHRIKYRPLARLSGQVGPWSSRRLAEGNGITTPRLSLRPVAPENLPDLIALKADEDAFGLMLHGTRNARADAGGAGGRHEFWLVRGYGTWAVYERATGDFLGITGLMERPDGRGIALRFSLWPACRGRGYAREAARAALAFGFRRGLPRIHAVAWEGNMASRQVLTDIGMAERDAFQHRGRRMLLFEALPPGSAG